MRTIKLLFFAGVFVLNACQTKVPTDLTKNNIIPVPRSVQATGGKFLLNADTKIYIEDGSSDLMKSAQFLQSKLQPSTGFDLRIESTSNIPSSGIYLSLSAENQEIGDEGYVLDISDKLITISAQKAAGVFLGTQTLRQILPDEIESNSIQKIIWEVPTGSIIDYPEYGYRGSMLDVARHFFTVDQVKRYIDLIAGLKMNVLHLHLTDDQGWRIEIKSWPKLTSHGGKTEVGGGEGGFYTQDDFKEIVQYAADRYITVIPEVDVPSHTFAALTSYPELNCDGKIQDKIASTGTPLTKDPYTGIEVGFCTLCIDSELTYQFMADVIRELADITPGPYLHMGGDESHVTSIDEYKYFMEKIQGLVIANNKQMIGWEEIIHTEMNGSTVMQYWARKDNKDLDFSQAKNVIMSPAHVAYLDMKYDSTQELGLNWAAFIEVDSAYRWDPTSISKTIKKDVILGIEAPLWSETLETTDDIEYMMFPRIMGHAEIGWSPQESRDWDDYKVRLGNQANRLKIMEIDFYQSKTVPWVQ